MLSVFTDLVQGLENSDVHAAMKLESQQKRSYSMCHGIPNQSKDDTVPLNTYIFFFNKEMFLRLSDDVKDHFSLLYHYCEGELAVVRLVLCVIIKTIISVQSV